MEVKLVHKSNPETVVTATNEIQLAAYRSAGFVDADDQSVEYAQPAKQDDQDSSELESVKAELASAKEELANVKKELKTERARNTRAAYQDKDKSEASPDAQPKEESEAK